MEQASQGKREKKRILRWRGVLADSSRKLRWMVALVLVVDGITLSFTQFGFVSVALPNGDSGYLVVLLQVVALGALLLGTLPGAGIAVIVGGVMLLHARMLPLDHYELAFVTPVTSVVMFAVTGLILGVLFAFALRNNPSQVKRIVYIAIVCVVSSWLYSLGFLFNVIISLAVGIFELAGADVSGDAIQQLAGQTAMQFGDVSMQAWGTALLMFVLCALGDIIARKVQAHEGALGLRTVFGAWLFVVVALSFMAMAAVSFGVSTVDALQDAEEDVRDEVAYLQKQLQISDQRHEMLRKINEEGELDFDKVDMTLLADFYDLIEDRMIIDGYTPEADGTVIVAFDDSLYATNDERLRAAASLSDAFTTQALAAIDSSIANDRMERFVFYDLDALRAFTESDETTNEDQSSAPNIAYVYAQEFIDAPASANGNEVSVKVVMFRNSDMVFAKRPSVMMSMTVSSLVLLLVVFLIVTVLLNRVVARRIDETNDVLGQVTQGNLDARVEARDTHEFESLSDGINTTVDTLKGWIAEAETRMDTELATAKEIQESALPRVFPPYPDILRFDIYASMKTAKEVGGDFYDFFLIGDDCGPDTGKLGFVMADVSGKGVPAALFMMKAKTQLRDYMESGMELGEAVENANRQLCDGNDAGMFVTVFAGVLDYTTRHIDYVNAGHNPPLLWQYEAGWTWVKDRSGLPLGLFDGMPYKAFSVDCEVGDQFLLYTDGVTEAMDTAGNLYGESRLEQLVRDNYFLHPRELLETVRRSVAEFTKDAEQSDDITILALEVGVPPEITARLTVDASVGELRRVNEFIHTELDRRLCPLRTQNQLDIAVEELFVNVAHYAYPDATPDNPGSVHISYTYSADPPSITVDIIDTGIPFDPLAKPDAVTSGDIAEVPIGGLGILMAKKSVDEMRYERVDGSNVVTIVKKW